MQHAGVRPDGQRSDPAERGNLGEAEHADQRKQVHAGQFGVKLVGAGAIFGAAEDRDAALQVGGGAGGDGGEQCHRRTLLGHGHAGVRVTGAGILAGN